MLKHKTEAYFPLPHKYTILLCLEKPFGKNCITQKPVYRFALQFTSSYMRRALTGSYWYGSNKDTPKTLQFAETSRYPDHPQGQIKFSIENGKGTESPPQIEALYDFIRNTLQH